MKEKINPTLSYPHETAPEPGAAIELGNGIYWLRVPIPFELNHINLWLLDDGEGYTLVDTGISAGRTRQAWEQIFTNIIKDKPLKRVIVTHFHPDHFGLAHWLCERSGAVYHASRETQERTDFLLNKSNKVEVDVRMAFYKHHGIEEVIFFEDFLKGSLYEQIVSGNLSAHHLLDDGELVRIGEYDWQVIMTYGHAPGHINLYCEALNMLISGDQILPSITSNVSVYADQAEADPLDEYLQSFEKFRSLPADTLVLPSHGKVFTGIHTRIAEIVGHHHEMLGKVRSICSKPHRTSELVPKLFKRKLEGINTVLATGETISNLNYLCKQGKLLRTLKAGEYVYQQH